jgi:hypothetical protein
MDLTDQTCDGERPFEIHDWLQQIRTSLARGSLSTMKAHGGAENAARRAVFQDTSSRRRVTLVSLSKMPNTPLVSCKPAEARRDLRCATTEIMWENELNIQLLVL